MSVLEAKGITKTFPGVTALDNVDLEIKKDEVHCIVGENGAGKSTLVKIFRGIYESDKGYISLHGKEVDGQQLHTTSNIAYVPQELNLFENLTVVENLFAPFQGKGKLFNKKKYEDKTYQLINRLEMDVEPRDLVNNISAVDQQLLQIGRALTNEDFEVLILDEPTAFLTDEEIERLFSILERLRDEGVAIVFITHVLDEVFELGDVVTVLRDGEREGHSNISEINESWIVQNMTGEEIDFERRYRPSKPPGDVILEVDKLTGERFSDVSFSLREGEILGIAGLVGSGRSEILQSIFGYLPIDQGEVNFKGESWEFGNPAYSIEKGLVYLPEERKSQGILPNRSLKENIGIMLEEQVAPHGIIDKTKDNQIAAEVIKDYEVKASSTHTAIKSLSGGNQQKVLIGRSMKAGPEVLFFDEPTRGIDVHVKEEVFELMKELAEEKRVGIVFISSELDEVIRCSNRIMSIYQGEKVREFDGDEIRKDDLVSSIVGMDGKSSDLEEQNVS